MKNYYQILGIDNTATRNDIRKAFRKKAFEFHPDLNKSKEAKDTFIKIYEAYEILLDDRKRKSYDEALNSNNDYAFRDKVTYEEVREKAEYVASLKLDEFDIYIKILLNNIPDVLFTSFIFIISIFLLIGSLFDFSLPRFLIGIIISVPLLIISLRDFYLILRVENFKKGHNIINIK